MALAVLPVQAHCELAVSRRFSGITGRHNAHHRQRWAAYGNALAGRHHTITVVGEKAQLIIPFAKFPGIPSPQEPEPRATVAVVLQLT